MDSLEDEMDANARPYLEQGSGDSLFEELFGSGAGRSDPDNEPLPAQPEVKQGKTLSLFPSLWTYVNTALEQLREQMERRGSPLASESLRSKSGWRSRPPAISNGVTSATPRNCAPPRANDWSYLRRWRHCNGPWSRPAAKTALARN